MIAVLFLAGCGPDVKNQHRYEKAQEAVEQYAKAGAFNPESMNIELVTDLLELDTVSDGSLFQDRRDYIAVMGLTEGKNASGEPVAQERVFFLTYTFEVAGSQSVEELSETERNWLQSQAL